MPDDFDDMLRTAMGQRPDAPEQPHTGGGFGGGGRPLPPPPPPSFDSILRARTVALEEHIAENAEHFNSTNERNNR